MSVNLMEGSQGYPSNAPSARWLTWFFSLFFAITVLVALSTWISIHNINSLRDSLQASCQIRDTQLNAAIITARSLADIERHNPVAAPSVAAGRIAAYNLEADTLSKARVNCEKQYR